MLNMKVMIEYKIKGREKKYPEISSEVFVSDEWSKERIKEWYEQRHSNIGIEVVKIERV